MNLKVVRLKNQKPVVIREAVPADAADLTNLVTCVFNTSNFTLTTPAEIDPDVEAQEQRILDFQKDKGSIIFVAEYEGQLVGTLDFKSNTKIRNRHWGEFGMGLRPEFRNQGLGRHLLKALLDWAEQHPVIEKVCLGVTAENEAGIHLYQSMGFVEEGRRIKALKISSEKYVDELRMYRFV